MPWYGRLIVGGIGVWLLAFAITLTVFVNIWKSS